MSSEAGLPSVSIQDSVLSTTFNSTMLGILLLGIYTTVYLGTLFIYLTKKSSRNLMVLAAITIIYVCNVAQISGQWVITKTLLLMAGQPKVASFSYALTATSHGWNVLLDEICVLTISGLADGLLIWRCYNVWDKSLSVIAVSSIFLLAEIGLYLSAIIIGCINHLNPATATVTATLNHLVSAAIFMTLGTTLLTTLLIVYRIHSTMRQNGLHRSRNPFQHILELLVQSAAPYAVVCLLFAIEGVVPENAVDSWRLYTVQNYTDVVFSIVAGMAPTVMVARVALASSGTVVHANSGAMTDLEFHAQSLGLATSHILGTRPQAGDSGTESRSSQTDEKKGGTEMLTKEI
ncbi:hypothetical protein HYPSUDRAFT_1096887 [Hypholoma sublateritium FD-334 SS-4]|uniref:Uncharacterized protein n=1 Tax=Hypholoma sublateritium (strain FD-334 SS-4) TaxID=945553 RepID=A0A0D2NJC9_HYPSF|nr:hypothetical protein HYPSUDRAFT_1096887 [Hypholoma sublateritium FD-334 SS-4]